MQTENTSELLAHFYREFSGLTLPADIVSCITPSDDALKSGQEESLPLVRICPPIVKPEGFFSSLQKVAEIMSRVRPELRDEIESLVTLLKETPGLPDTMFSPGFAETIEAPAGSGFSLETYRFLLTQVKKKIMTHYGRQVTALYRGENWMRGFCPVCGERPSLGVIGRDDGRRRLYCGLCGAKWNYLRMGCPFCAHEESQFFTLEGMEKYRIYFCEKCRGYLKTIDEKETDGAPLDMDWEDISTSGLDMLAMQEGFTGACISPEDGGFHKDGVLELSK